MESIPVINVRVISKGVPDLSGAHKAAHLSLLIGFALNEVRVELARQLFRRLCTLVKWLTRCAVELGPAIKSFDEILLCDLLQIEVEVRGDGADVPEKVPELLLDTLRSKWVHLSIAEMFLVLAE